MSYGHDKLKFKLGVEGGDDDDILNGRCFNFDGCRSGSGMSLEGPGDDIVEEGDGDNDDPSSAVATEYVLQQ